MASSDFSVADKLDEARALIEKRGAWTQRTFARKEDGVPCDPDRAEAVCFCAMGALARALNIHYAEVEHTAPFRKLSDAVGEWPAQFNDKPGRRKRDVIAAFKRAAELARQEQSA